MMFSWEKQKYTKNAPSHGCVSQSPQNVLTGGTLISFTLSGIGVSIGARCQWALRHHEPALFIPNPPRAHRA